MKINTPFQEVQKNKIERYLSFVRHRRQRPDLITPDVVYKLSLMALDELNTAFLAFYDTQIESVDTISLLRQVQGIVYVDDTVVEDLNAIVTAHDRQIKAHGTQDGVSETQAQQVSEDVAWIYRFLAAYLPY